MTKKTILSAIFIFFSTTAFSQTSHSFQFGLKGGLTAIDQGTSYSDEEIDAIYDYNYKHHRGQVADTEDQTGYYAGVWIRFDKKFIQPEPDLYAAINFQPELYFARKNKILYQDGIKGRVKFTTLDLPLLIGGKLHADWVDITFNTGPVFSLVLDKKQSFDADAGTIVKGSFKNQAFAWQYGIRSDFNKIGFDFRYEQGLSKLGEGDNTALKLWTIGLTYKFF